MIRLLLALLLFIPSVSFASVTIDAQVIRNQSGSGSTFITSGFPVRPGDVTEAMITGGLIKVYVNEGSGLAEKQCNITGLRGRFADGSLRSILIQFQVDSMQQNNTANDYALPAQVVIDNGARSSADSTYHLVTWTDVTNNNVILATSPDFLVETQLTFQKLIPYGEGTAVEQELYDSMMELRFNDLVTFEATAGNDSATANGGASYERDRAILAAFARTGDQKYQKKAVYKQESLTWGLKYLTPASTYTDTVAVVNPDGRPNGGDTGHGAEQESPRSFSAASMYLMTGYRDFWSITAHLARWNLTYASTQAAVYAKMPRSTTWDLQRTNYFELYSALIPAYCIDATYPVPISGQPAPVASVDWEDQFDWVLNAIEATAWNIRWIPYSGGSGVVPAQGVTVSQGAVSATAYGFHPVSMADPKRYPGKTMPATGWIMINTPTGGSFTSGALTFSGLTPPSASATGADVTDYRNGMTGTSAYSLRVANNVTLNATFSGTTMTVNNVYGGTVVLGRNLYVSGIVPGTYIVSQTSGTTGDVGVYEVSESQTITGPIDILSHTIIPIFQFNFVNNFLIDYYFNVKADSRIPDLVKANIDPILKNTEVMVPGDLHYGAIDATYGSPVYGQPYHIEQPPIHSGAAYALPEFARSIAFLIKTKGNQTVEGATYSTWYDRATDAANINRAIFGNTGGAVMPWKNFGQFYGWNQDSPWMISQETISGPSTARTPTQWNAIPSATPDLARGVGGGGTKWKLKSITVDE